MPIAAPAPRFFSSRARFRAWLAANHARKPELWVGFWKAHTGKKSLTYDEAVDESLCFGWIDGLAKGVDGAAYMQRFTPRRPRSVWSAINVRKVEKLKEAGLMAPAGLAAFEGRDPKRAGLYSYENRQVQLAPEFVKRFRAAKAAWKFFEVQPPGYRRLAAFWVMSAKRKETRERRFAQLVAESARGVRSGAVSG
ncbi:MAG: YdeI/OmpD-associated family protein [Usitatibacter sp.]